MPQRWCSSLASPRGAAAGAWMRDAHRLTCPMSLCFSGAKGSLVQGT